MGDYDYWSILIPYIDCDFDDNQLIEGSTFSTSPVVWETYFNSGESGEETQTVVSLSQNNEFLNYNIVYGQSTKQGTYIGRLSSHPNEEIGETDYTAGVGYGIAISQGDIDIPTYGNFSGAGTLEYDFSTGLNVSFDQSAEITYQGETSIIDENWRKYNDDESFSSALEGALSDLAIQVLNNTNKGEPIFIFRKTISQPIKLNELSPIEAVDTQSTTQAQPSVTATTSVVLGTTGGY